MQHDLPRIRVGGGRSVQMRLQEADELVDLGLLGLRLVRRGHEPPAQLAHRLLPDLGVLPDALRTHRVEGDTAGPIGRVVALAAVLVEESPLRGLVRRGLCVGPRGTDGPRG